MTYYERKRDEYKAAYQAALEIEDMQESKTQSISFKYLRR